MFMVMACQEEHSNDRWRLPDRRLRRGPKTLRVTLASRKLSRASEISGFLETPWVIEKCEVGDDPRQGLRCQRHLLRLHLHYIVVDHGARNGICIGLTIIAGTSCSPASTHVQHCRSCSPKAPSASNTATWSAPRAPQLVSHRPAPRGGAWPCCSATGSTRRATRRLGEIVGMNAIQDASRFRREASAVKLLP